MSLKTNDTASKVKRHTYLRNTRHESASSTLGRLLLRWSLLDPMTAAFLSVLRLLLRKTELGVVAGEINTADLAEVPPPTPPPTWVGVDTALVGVGHYGTK